MKSGLQPMMADLLSPATVERRGLFDPGAVAALRAATEAGRVDGHYSLLALMAIELWCRAFADQVAPVSAAA